MSPTFANRTRSMRTLGFIISQTVIGINLLTKRFKKNPHCSNEITI